MPNHKSSMVRDLFETFGANALLVSLGALTSIVIARILGPAMRGELAVILLWSGIFSTLGSFGINESLGYFSGIRAAKRWKYLHTSVLVTASAAIVLFIPFVFSIPVLMKTYSARVIHLGMVSVGFGLFFIPQFMLAQSYLQGNGLIRHLNLINLLNGLLYFCFILIIWMFFPRGDQDLGLTVTAYIATYLILLFISFTLLTMLRRKEWESWNEGFWSLGYSELKNLLKYGSPVTIANLLNQTSTKLDQIFLSFLVSPELIGFYAVALSTSTGISVSALTISTIGFPRITNACKIEERKSVIRKLFLSYYFSVVPIFLLTLFAVPYLIPTLFGSAFTGAVKASQIFLGGALFVGLNQIFTTILKALGLPRYVMGCRVLALGLLGLCLSLLVPKYDILGAAWAVVISNSMASVLTILLVSDKAGIQAFDMVIPRKEDIKTIRETLLKLRGFGQD